MNTSQQLHFSIRREQRRKFCYSNRPATIVTVCTGLTVHHNKKHPRRASWTQENWRMAVFKAEDFGWTFPQPNMVDHHGEIRGLCPICSVWLRYWMGANLDMSSKPYHKRTPRKRKKRRQLCVVLNCKCEDHPPTVASLNVFKGDADAVINAVAAAGWKLDYCIITVLGPRQVWSATCPHCAVVSNLSAGILAEREAHRERQVIDARRALARLV